MRTSKAYNTHQALAALTSRMSPGSAITTNACHIALFSGTPPTDDQLNAMVTTTSSGATWSAAAISAFATAANFLGDVMLSTFTPTMDFDNNVIQLPFGGQMNMVTVATSGTPTWFMMRLAQTVSAADTFAGFAAGATAYEIIVGTVGDENSEADMKILGGAVVAGQPVRIADMRIKL